MFCALCLDDLAAGATCAVHRDRLRPLTSRVVAGARIERFLDHDAHRIRFAGVDERSGRAVVLAAHAALASDASHEPALRARCADFTEPVSPHVDELIACEVVDGRPWIVAPQRTGHRLADEAGPPPDRLARMLDGVLAGLVALHARGLVHGNVQRRTIWLEPHAERDFVPVLVEPELDLMFAAHHRPRVTQLRAWTTTAPEQLTGLPVTLATDVYGFGAMLYELLRGAPPFDGPDLGFAILTQPVAPLAPSRLDLPPALCSLVHACLERDPARRPANAHELATRLDAIALVADAPLDPIPLAYGGDRARPGKPIPPIPVLDEATLEARERELLAALRADPRDLAVRQVYADWLEQHGQGTRAQFLRLDADDATHELALRSYATRAQVTWRGVVSRARVLCSRRDDPACPGRWSELGPVASPGPATSLPPRRCGTCTRDVHYVASPHEARRHAVAADAIAVDASLPLARAAAAYYERRWHQPMPIEYMSPPTRPLAERPALIQRLRRWLRR